MWRLYNSSNEMPAWRIGILCVSVAKNYAIASDTNCRRIYLSSCTNCSLIEYNGTQLADVNYNWIESRMPNEKNTVIITSSRTVLNWTICLPFARRSSRYIDKNYEVVPCEPTVSTRHASPLPHPNCNLEIRVGIYTTGSSEQVAVHG